MYESSESLRLKLPLHDALFETTSADGCLPAGYFVRRKHPQLDQLSLKVATRPLVPCPYAFSGATGHLSLVGLPAFVIPPTMAGRTSYLAETHQAAGRRTKLFAFPSASSYIFHFAVIRLASFLYLTLENAAVMME